MQTSTLPASSSTGASCYYKLTKLYPVNTSIALAIIIANVYLSICISSVLAQSNNQQSPSSRQYEQNRDQSRWTQHSQPQTNPPQRLIIDESTNITPPQVISRQNELVVGAGSNVTLTCTARGSPPLTFVWFQDEKNLTTSRGNSSEPPSSTKLLEEKRYEIAEELEPPFGSSTTSSSSSDGNITTSLLYLFNLKRTDTSLFLCWVENKAGYTIANFSLVVNDSPPAHLTNGETPTFPSSAGSLWRTIGLSQSEAQMGFVTIGFVIVLIAGVIFLLMFKHSNADENDSRVVDSNDVKGGDYGNPNTGAKKLKKKGLKSKHIQHLHTNQNGASIIHSSVSKYNGQMPINRSIPVSDDDEENCTLTDDGSTSLADSNSSCQKASSSGYPKVMAASDLDNFIEHMRSGIINMDYHSMSPVIQFNNTLKKQHHEQQHQQTPFTNHHFASASGASSAPYSTYGPQNGSMTTTTSDLSPGAGSGNTQQNMIIGEPGATNIGSLQRLAPNCDQYSQNNQNRNKIHNINSSNNMNSNNQHHQLSAHIQQPMHIDMLAAPATNTTTTSYTSDYNSGYSGADDPASSAISTGSAQVGNLLPPMYYEATENAIHPYPAHPMTSSSVQQQQLHHQLMLNQQQQMMQSGGQAGAPGPTLVMQDMMHMLPNQRFRMDPYNQFL